MSNPNLTITGDNPSHVVITDPESGHISIISESGASWAAQAVAAANQAQGYLQSFNGTYYGALASDPALDPNGNAPTAGDLYFKTGSGLHVYDGAVWTAYTPAPAVSIPALPSHALEFLRVNSAETGVEFALPSRLQVTAASNLDLDSVFSLGQGVWTHSLSGVATNGPPGLTLGPGDIVSTFVVGTSGHQFLYDLSLLSDGAPHMWVRMRISGSFTPWQRIGSFTMVGAPSASGNLDALAGSAPGVFHHKITGAVSNAPPGAGVGSFVETSVFDTNAAFQRVMVWDASIKGTPAVYDRRKVLGAWRPWYQVGGEGWMPSVGSDGVLYDSASDGTVASVLTPDFKDGFEYKFMFEDFVAPANVGVRAQFFYETAAAWSAAIPVSGNAGSGAIHTIECKAISPRRNRRVHYLDIVSFGSVGSAPFNGSGSPWGVGTSTADKVLRMKLFWQSGNITSGRIIMLQRRVHGGDL